MQAYSFEGSSSDPLSLHKYLYANASPVDLMDPSGNFSISETLGTFGIHGIVNTMSTLMIKGFIGGAIIGGLEAALRGDDILEGAIQGGLLGSVLGPLRYSGRFTKKASGPR